MSGRAGSEPLLLSRHAPRVALEWATNRPDQRARVVDGTLLFVDISGFTALSERLAARGRVGAEELVETLSDVFGSILDLVVDRQGSMLKFGGDALLLAFFGDDHVEHACSLAVEVRRELRRASQLPTAVGRISLSASIGVHTGDVHLFLVGHRNRELVVAGPATSEVLAREAAADAGQILVSTSTASRLRADAVRRRADGELLLRWREPRVPSIGPLPDRSRYEPAARDLVPALLVQSLDGRRPDPAHRVATIAFMRLGGLDDVIRHDGPAATAVLLDGLMSGAQDAFAAEDVALIAVDCDRDGLKLMCCSGVPLTSEDDEGRMLRAARRMLGSSSAAWQIGINRGHVFAAEVGTPTRAAFSAMGTTTNLAARICAKTAPGSMWAHPTVLEHARTRHAARPVGPIAFKGVQHPVVLHEVGEELGPRERERSGAGTPLVGRQAEVAQIRSRADDLEAGAGAVVVVAGPVGVGKTRVVDEALAGLSDDVDSIAVRAEPYGASSAYRVFRDPVRAMLGIERDEPDRMSVSFERGIARWLEDLGPLAALLADVAHVELADRSAVTSIADRHRADRLADVVVELVARTHPGPLVIRAEDVHWADDASAHLLTRLSAETSRRPWLVLQTRRDDTAGLLPDGVERADRVELGALDDDQARLLVEHATEAAPLRPHEVEQIIERAGGNPRWLLELVRAVGELGSVDAVPASLQGAMAALVDVVEPVTKRVLAHAAVLGRSFRRSLLSSMLVADGLALDPATRARVADFLVDDGGDRLRFRDGVLRDAVYDGLGFRLRSRLHAVAGGAIEEAASDPMQEADPLSLHFVAAADHPRAFRYSVAAGRRAARAQANAEAAAAYRRALDAARWLPDVDDTRRRELHVAMGEACERAGLHDRALDAYRHALALTPDDPVERAEIRLRRARVREATGAFSSALRETTSLRNAVGRDGRARAAVRARAAAFASTIRLHQERPREAERLASAAIVEAEACDERAALARASSTMAWARLVTGGDDAADHFRRALALYRELGDLPSQAHMENNLGVQAYFDGRWDDTVAHYHRAAAACREVGDLVNASLTEANLGEVLVNQGRIDEALVFLRAAVRQLQALGSTTNATFAGMHLGRALLARGDLAEAEEPLRRAVEVYGELGAESAFEASLHLAEWWIARGEPTAALQLLADAEVRSSDEQAIFNAAGHLVAARANEALGRVELARDHVVDGVVSARSLGLGYDLARLLLMADRLDVDDERIGESDAVAAANALLAELGVRELSTV